ncbi:MAG: c-type cytochrome [Helicobacteraceae bacterium]|nr:c-type cytochrome [Helicobacteraceae bacterium]
MNYLTIIALFITTLLAQDVTPLPKKFKYDKSRAALGKKLFFDPILSIDSTVACASCHFLPGGGADNKDFSKGVDGKVGTINSPTVLNSRYNFVQFWDGREKDLKAQAIVPIENPIEMANTMQNVVKTLKKDPNYKKEFNKVYKDGITAKNIADAIAEFESALVTPNSPFDEYLRGNNDAISAEAKEGYRLFKEYGCISCHNGVNVGGNMYQKVGIMLTYKSKHGNKGRYNITKESKDLFYFKVPTLRNIELTAPYFHDGQIATLYTAIKDMAEHQLGIRISDTNVKKIELFLNTLTGETPEILKDK